MFILLGHIWEIRLGADRLGRHFLDNHGLNLKNEDNFKKKKETINTLLTAGLKCAPDYKN